MLVSMLITIGLLAAFSVVAVRVFRLSMQTVERSAREQELLIREGQAMGVMREDVWGAAKVAVEAKRVRLSEVEWQTEGDGALVRSAGDDVRRWTGLGVMFERQGSWVVVRRGEREVALLRQRAAGGGR
jgi:type II secretory pathway component PulJ